MIPAEYAPAPCPPRRYQDCIDPTAAADIAAHVQSAALAQHVANEARRAIGRAIGRARATGATEKQIAAATGINLAAAVVENWVQWAPGSNNFARHLSPGHPSHPGDTL